MFGRRKKQITPPYNKDGKVPVIRSSICIGEQVAGFKDLTTGKFDDLMLIRDSSDFAEFLLCYQVDEDEIQREW